MGWSEEIRGDQTEIGQARISEIVLADDADEVGMRTVRGEGLFDPFRYRTAPSALKHFDVNHVSVPRSVGYAQRPFVRNVHYVRRFETGARVDHVAGDSKNSASAEIQRQA